MDVKMETEVKETEKSEMTAEQFDNFKKMINYEAMQALNKFIDAEIEAQKDNANQVDFFRSLCQSEFFQSFFERGFIEGIDWEKRNRYTKFVF